MEGLRPRRGHRGPRPRRGRRCSEPAGWRCWAPWRRARSSWRRARSRRCSPCSAYQPPASSWMGTAPRPRCDSTPRCSSARTDSTGPGRGFGTLLLLSLFERRACLLPDAAIRDRVSDAELADVIARVTQAAARGEIGGGALERPRRPRGAARRQGIPRPRRARRDRRHADPGSRRMTSMPRAPADIRDGSRWQSSPSASSRSRPRRSTFPTSPGA